MSETALLIVNPFSGNKSGEKNASYISGKLAASGIASQVYVSRSVEALGEFLRSRPLSAFSFIGIIGGDGTMHEFINLALSDNAADLPPLALFPCGTGNAFNLDIGCNTVDETLGCIAKQTISFIDVAEVQYSDRRLWSFNILGCGLVAEINILAEKMRFLRGSRYNVAAVIKLLVNPVKQMRVKTDGMLFDGRYSFLLACNTRFTGKGMMMAPHAQLNDGKFDVILVEACSRWKLLKLFPKIFKGGHIGAKELQYLQVSELELETPGENLPTNIDGEVKGASPLRFTVHRNKVRVFVK